MLHRRPTRILFALAVGVPVLAAIPGDSLILAILGISFLIFIHEWGHFYACKLTGTRTETFSIGFGKRLFGWEKDREGNRRFTVGRRQMAAAEHAMDFRVALIPLGGYVKMAGEIPGEGSGGPGGKPAPDEFPAKSALARTFIVSAGVIMNFITAIVFYFVAIQAGKAYKAPVAGSVRPGGAAWMAGIEPGDRVLSIHGNDTPTFTDLRMEVAFADPDEDNPVVVQRGDQRVELSMRPVYDEETGILSVGLGEAAGLELAAPTKGGEAFAIGPLEDVAVDGVPARGGQAALGRLLSAFDAGRYPVTFARQDGTTFDLRVSEDAAAAAEASSPGAKVGLTGYLDATVKAVRARAAGTLAKGDVVRAALSGETRVAIESRRDWDALPFLGRVDGFAVERGGEARTVEVVLADAAAIAAFQDDVALDRPTDSRVLPLQAGALYFPGDALYRYPSAPALDAGIRAGDRITRIGDRVITTFVEIPKALEDRAAGKPVEIELVGADGETRTVSVVPIELERMGAVGVTPVEYKEHWQARGLEALGLGFDRTVRETQGVFRTIGALFTGNISFNKNIAGPITLITASKRFAEDDLLKLVWFLAYVSVMLAVLNILPIPILDGGHLMFILFEKIKGKPLDDRTIYNLQRVGFLLLLVLMFFAFKNDITRLINVG